MSLYDDAALMFVPSGFKAAKLYSIKPEDGTGDFTVARNSIASRINENLEIENVAVNVPRLNYESGVTCPALLTEPQRTQLITYPVSFGNSYWTKSGATIEGDPSTAGSAQNVSACANGDYTTFGSASATGFTATSDGGGTHEAGTADEIVFPLNQMVKVTFTLTLNSGTAPTVSIKTALAGTNIANAKTFTPVAGSNTSYFLISTATTGLVEFQNTSTATDFTIADLSVTFVTGYPSPSVDYSTSAYLLSATSDNGYIQLATPLSISNTTDYANSIWVKRATGTGTVYIKDINNAETEITVDNTWQRFDVTSESTSTSGQIGIKLATSGDEVYIFHAQAEAGAYPTSDILAAEGATVTRLADVITGAGDAATFNLTEGVLYAEIAALADDGTSRRISLSDGTTFNRVTIIYNTTSNEVISYISYDGTVIAQFSYTLSDVTQYSKIAVKWKENDFSFWVDGVKRGTDSEGAAPLGLDQLKFVGSIDTNNFYGKTKGVYVFNRALTDTELENLTK